jgi:hypothetical protein
MRALLLGSLLLVTPVGCGGSSSETPPPLEPDPTSALYSGPRMPRPEDDVKPPPAPEPDEDDKPTAPSRPAKPTWGGGR